jgi:RHS repeat-associated protein
MSRIEVRLFPSAVPLQCRDNQPRHTTDLFSLFLNLTFKSARTRKNKLACLRIAPIAMSFVVLSICACAQTPDPGIGAGVFPYQTYLGEHENINLGTGNLNVQIPLLKLPGRDGHDFALNLTYNSQIWYLFSFTNPHTQQTTYSWTFNSGGWQMNTPTLLSTQGVYPNTIGPSEYTCTGNYRLTMWDGRVIYFPAVYSSCWWNNPNGQGNAAPSYDNLVGTSEGGPYPPSVYACAPDRAVLTVNDTGAPYKVSFPSGETLWFNNNVLWKDEDANGNVITYSSGTITDTIGRTITTGTNGQATVITYHDSNGTQQTITLNYQTHTITTGFPTPLLGEENQTYNWSDVTSVVMPNGDAWTMSYDNGGSIGYGELTKITYPTGGYSTYQYAFSGAASGDTVAENSLRQVVGKKVCRSFSGICSTTDNTVITPTPATANPYSSVPTNASSQVVDAVGDLTTYTFGSSGLLAGYESQRKIYSGASTLLETVQTTPSCFGPGSETVTLANGLVSKKTFPGTIGPTTSYGYKTTNSPGSGPFTTTGQEFAFGNGAPGALVRQTVVTWLGTNPVNGTDYTAVPINPTDHKVYATDRKTGVSVEDGSGNPISQTNYEYDNYSAAAPHATLATSGATQHDTAYNASTGYTWRGNVTQTQRWLNSNSTWLYTTNQVDDAGNILKTTDPMGYATGFSYADSWGNTTCTPSGGSGSAYLTSVTNALSQVTKHTYNSCTGTLDSTTDPNNEVTTYRTSSGGASYDALGRLTQTDYPDGGQTTVCYSDDPSSGCNTSQPQLSTTTTTLITSSLAKTSLSLLDGVGNVVRTELTSDPSGTDYVDTAYDGVGRKVSVSNPYRTTSDLTYGLTTYQYDGLSRVTKMIPPDGSGTADNVTTSFDIAYTGTAPPENCNIVTDEAGKARKSCFDGLARMVQVFEDPSVLDYETDYAYDLLDDLTSVTQKGSNSANARTRTFAYDSLARLTSAGNPESGSISYIYDNDGNVLTKTSPLPNQTGSSTVTTTNTYDQLNRLTKKSYMDGNNPDPYTFTVRYGYDGVALSGCTVAPPGDTDSYPVGRRTSMCDGSGAAEWTHDKMGRLLQERRTIGTVLGKYDIDAYNLDGSPSSITTVGYSVGYLYSSAARPVSATYYGTNPNTQFVSSATYAPPGELAGAILGSVSGGFTGFTVANAYNNRLQPILLSATTPTATVFSECFDFHLGIAVNTTPCSFSSYSTGDNGNVYQIVNNRSSIRSQSFNYDSLNRLANGQQTTGTQWGESYTIDAWGNMTAIGSYNGKPHESLSTSALPNNQLSGFGYDAAGNMTSNGSTSYIYDAENRLIADPSAGYSYIYDGDGQRVEKCTEVNTPGACASNATGTLYWRGLDSETLRETDLAGNLLNNYIFFNGQRVARSDSLGAVHYYFSDQVGSHAVVENATGTVCEQDIDYYPYGGVEDDYCSGSGVVQNYKFTGKERDGESNLDYFGARHYDNALGRFMQPDWSRDPDPIPYADYENPQTLNLYQYVENNPLNAWDPDGHAHWGPCPNDSSALCWTGDTDGEEDKENGTVWNDKDQKWEQPPQPSSWQQFLAWRQNFIKRWNQRIDAHKPPPQKGDDNLQFLQNINNLMMGMVPYKAPLARDISGRIHQDIPDHVPDDWTQQDLETAKSELEESIKQRNVEQSKYGEDGGHREQIRQEEHLLRQVEKKLSGS